MVHLTQLLQQPSSSSQSQVHPNNYTYDVFLSFRGVDTRNRFTDHLYNALLDANLTTFLDDHDIETGEPLKPELENAIKSSRASIIILSNNYASSTWCLDELVLILNQKMKCKQIVIPIFYDVEPTDVRKQQGSFGEAMAKHKQKMEDETDAVKRSELAKKIELWKMALTQAADLKGKDANNRKETDFIKDVVTDIQRRLRVPLSTTLPRLIGREDNIEFIGSWLTDGSCHVVDILTVVGMGGIGKTSLARYVFGLHSSEFDKSSFIEGVNARCKESYNGLLDLQKQLHGDISKKILLHVNDVIEYTSKIEHALVRKRSFIVLDDIDSLDQLNALLGSKSLHPGSKIIITTKDASLTQSCALFHSQVHRNHHQVLLDGLCYFESLNLLCSHAFQSQKPKEGYECVSKELVKYCEGHPLALEVLGGSLHNQDVSYWENCIEVLKKEPHSRINKALKMSFDSLPFDNDKELFKYISCFFVGKDKDVTETILNACDIKTRIGFTNLINRCLIKIEKGNMLKMHQLVQAMGRDLVRQESPKKPWKRSRLWCHEESFKVLKEKKGKGNLLGLTLDMRMLDKKKLHGSSMLKTKSFTQMDNLMLLELKYVQLNGCFDNFPEELRWLCMHGSSLKSITRDLPMEKLVNLDMSHSTIESFDISYSNPQPFAKRQKGLVGSSSKDKQLLGSLKILDLGFCEQLCYLGGFSELPVLERLIVRNCISLIEVCESIEHCDELVHIDLSYCYKLKKVPASIWKLKKVKTLLLDGINSRKSQIKTIACDFQFFEISLPCSLTRLSLENNNLCNESFPRDWSCLAMLKELSLSYNPIVSMPNCVSTLSRLDKLDMSFCSKLTLIEHPPRTLRELSISSYTDNYNTVLRKIKFDPEMSPLSTFRCGTFLGSPFEIDGIIKIQPITDVEENVLQSLGWINADFNRETRLCVYNDRLRSVQTQFFYEFGIFSTFYMGEGMPDWITCRSNGGSISFTIPSSPKKLKGLNVCCCMVPSYEISCMNRFYLPQIKISNVTKNQTWIYKHIISTLKSDGKCLIWLSHLMFGANEMKCDDHIAISIEAEQVYHQYFQVTKECGIGVVYEDGDMEERKEEDVLGSYTSWNHIIGGDLSPFQTTTGRYSLRTAHYKPGFIAFSQKKKSDVSINEGELTYRRIIEWRFDKISQLQEPPPRNLSYLLSHLHGLNIP